MSGGQTLVFETVYIHDAGGTMSFHLVYIYNEAAKLGNVPSDP